MPISSFNRLLMQSFVKPVFRMFDKRYLTAYINPRNTIWISLALLLYKPHVEQLYILLRGVFHNEINLLPLSSLSRSLPVAIRLLQWICQYSSGFPLHKITLLALSSFTRTPSSHKDLPIRSTLHLQLIIMILQQSWINWNSVVAPLSILVV